MSDFGTFIMDRGWFEHPVFAQEAFTEREAWAWMIARAASTDRTRRVGNVAVPLRRGQFAHSIRFLGKRFQWSHSRVQRFLARLVTESMIDTVAESEVTCVTIRNYDKYQSKPAPADTANESPPIQTKKESITTTALPIDGGADRAREAVILPQAFQLADDVMKTLAISTEFIPPGWCGLPMWLQTGLTSGWKPELIRIAAAKLRARRGYQPPYSFKYLGGPIDRAHQEFATPPLPMPPVGMSQPESNHGPAQQQSAPDWRGRRDEQHATYRAFKQAAERSLDESNRGVVRLVPNAGRR